MNYYTVKKYLNDKIGKRCCIKYNLGRNKYEITNGKLNKLYSNIFTVEDEDNFIKSFSYNDVIMHQIAIDFKE